MESFDNLEDPGLLHLVDETLQLVKVNYFLALFLSTAYEFLLSVVNMHVYYLYF